MTLDKTQTTLLYGGATTTVTANTTPSDYDANNLTWTISDTSLATISGTGKTRTITSNNTKKTGETTLTVSGGRKTVTMKVSIVNFTTTTYSYTGSVQQVDLPAGTYKLEVWGAQGGSNGGSGGKGGYSVGILTLSNNTTVYVYVGGTTTSKSGGFNGGGTASSSDRGGGGGSTDIRTVSNSLYSRIIVAGGGGGAYDSAGGGFGGGIEGGAATSGCQGYGGTQTSSGTGHCNSGGGFGIGGNGKSGSTVNGGGGGWYGGGGSNGSGGGSGYVYTSSTASNYPSGCLLNSSYYLTDAQTIAGNQSFPNVAGTGNETGHSGNGAAKITPVN